jgi:gluconolactonase
MSKRSISRRRILAMSAAAGGAVVSGGTRRAFAQTATRIEQFAPELDAIVSTSEPIRELASGTGVSQGPTEGPVWWREGGYLLYSDIHNDRRMRYTPGQGASVFKTLNNRANGLTRDREGRLVACERLTRRVTRQELDGSITVIA